MEDLCELCWQQMDPVNLREVEKAGLLTKYPAKPYWKRKSVSEEVGRIRESSATDSLADYIVYILLQKLPAKCCLGNP